MTTRTCQLKCQDSAGPLHRLSHDMTFIKFIMDYLQLKVSAFLRHAVNRASNPPPFSSGLGSGIGSVVSLHFEWKYQYLSFHCNHEIYPPTRAPSIPPSYLLQSSCFHIKKCCAYHLFRTLDDSLPSVHLEEPCFAMFPSEIPSLVKQNPT